MVVFFDDSLEINFPDSVEMCTGTQKNSHEQLSPDNSIFKSTCIFSCTIFLSSLGNMQLGACGFLLEKLTTAHSFMSIVFIQ